MLRTSPHPQDAERAGVDDEILQRPKQHGVHRGRRDQHDEQDGQHAQVTWPCSKVTAVRSRHSPRDRSPSGCCAGRWPRETTSASGQQLLDREEQMAGGLVEVPSVCTRPSGWERAKEEDTEDTGGMNRGVADGRPVDGQLDRLGYGFAGLGQHDARRGGSPPLRHHGGRKGRGSVRAVGIARVVPQRRRVARSWTSSTAVTATCSRLWAGALFAAGSAGAG